MIPKSGNRFSEKIMRKQNKLSCCKNGRRAKSPPAADR
jgi:hypothetical protein